MILSREEIFLDPEFPLEAHHHIIESDKRKSDNCHWHDCCEITLINKGNALYFVNGQEYQVESEDIIIFNPVEAHGWQVKSEPFDVSVLVFSLNFLPMIQDDFLKSFIQRGSSFNNKLSRKESSTKLAAEIIREIFNEFQNEARRFRTLITGDILRLLTLLSRFNQNKDFPNNEKSLCPDGKYPIAPN